jgi:ankyrin repeat protein
MYKVAEGVRPPVSVDKIGSQKFASLLEACWAQEPDDRPNFDSILYELDDAALARDVQALQLEYEVLMKRTSEIANLNEKQKIEALSKSLMDVMQSGDVKEAGRLVAAGAQVQFADYDRRRPLHIAAAEGHKECVMFLLSRGARVLSQDRWGGTAIDDAKQGGHREIVSLLLAARSNPEQEKPSNSMLALPEINVGEDRQSQSSVDPLVVATDPIRSNGDLEWKGDVKSRRSRMRVAFDMMFGVHDHDIELVRKLLSGSHDANGTDYDSRTPLHIAAAVGDKEIAQLLIDYGADVFAADKWGVDPFREAQRSGHSEVAHLIEKAQFERERPQGVPRN